MADDNGLPDRLAAFISTMEPDVSGVAVDGVERSGIGFSRENWIFNAEWDEGSDRSTHPLIMRRDPAGSVLTTDRRAEFALLKALEATEIPAPRARWIDPDGRWFERPSLFMDRIEGECQMFAIEGPNPLEERLRLGGDCLELLSRIHRLDWLATGAGAAVGFVGTGGALREIEHWEREMRDQEMEVDSRREELLSWLSANAPEPQTMVLVHGDFKPGNMLLRDGRIVALLDWETAHIGDPVEDLGWITNPLRRREHQIPIRWEEGQMIERYEGLTGWSVDPSALRFWKVMANFKLAVIVLTGIRSYTEGRSNRSFNQPTTLVDLALALAQGTAA